MMMKPNARPARPDFSSGPCAKRPGWTPEALKDAAVGRSHRSKLGKKKIVEAVDRTRAILGIPADYRTGIVPASDTGAVEMALWSLLGARPVDVLTWESFGEGWVTDVAKQLKLKDMRTLKARLRQIARPERSRLDARRRLHLERHDLRRARAERRLDPDDARGAGDLRRDLRRVRDGPAVGQARCRDLVLAEGAGRGGRARHAGAVARAPSRGSKATSPPGRCRRSSA